MTTTRSRDPNDAYDVVSSPPRRSDDYCDEQIEIDSDHRRGNDAHHRDTKME